jgi:ankyrin repeat protein
MKSSELIHRYLIGGASAEEVRELESRLQSDETLQDEYLLQAELDAHLRQQVQIGLMEDDRPKPAASPRASHVWKWVSGISTLAATILLALIILNFPPSPAAMAYPSLGQLTVQVSRTEHNIWAAAADGDLNAVRNELENRVSVNAKAECGLTPLHVATLFDQLATVDLLLSSGAEVSLTDGEGNTALHMAAFLGHTDIVRALLKVGTDPAVRNHLGFSSVDNVAVKWSSGLETYYHNVEKVLSTSLDLERIQSERPKILQLLSAANINTPDRTPTISLWQAVITGNTAAVEEHIVAATDLDAKEDYGGSTPLILAAIFGKKEVARILIDAGADLELRNSKGSTALHQACFFCRPEIVEMLLVAGADPSQTNNDGRTPLEIVTLDFDGDLQGAYLHVYDWLNLKPDLDDIKRARIQIADILSAHTSSKDRN